MKSFSIIIPTMNRFEKLLKVLSALEMQSFSKSDLEVILVNDGSTDEEYARLEDLHELFSYQLITLKQANKGAAAARNLGIDVATGKYILFLGDDTYPHKDLLKEHLLTHQDSKESICVLGLVAWEKSLQLNELMQFIAPKGPQFNYSISNTKDVGYKRFYTSNISIPSYILKEEKFYEGFPGVNLEDIELGYRLEAKNMKIHYNANAIVYHDHFYESVDNFVKRQEAVGRNKTILLKLHPELENIWSNLLYLKCVVLIDKVKIIVGKLLKNNRLYLGALFEKASVEAFLKEKKRLLEIE